MSEDDPELKRARLDPDTLRSAAGGAPTDELLRASGLPTPSELLPQYGAEGAEGRVRAQILEFEDWRNQRSGAAASNPSGSQAAGPTDSMDETGLSALEGFCEALDSWFESSGWSGDIETYMNGRKDLIFEHSEDSAGQWSLLSSRGGEVKLKDLSGPELEQFRQSDEAEWGVLNKQNVLRILSKEESARVLRTRPERVLSSRMVRRWKAQEGTFSAPKAKSRWCVHGFADPDTEHIVTLRRPSRKL